MEPTVFCIIWVAAYKYGYQFWCEEFKQVNTCHQIRRTTENNKIVNFRY